MGNGDVVVNRYAYRTIAIHNVGNKLTWCKSMHCDYTESLMPMVSGTDYENTISAAYWYDDNWLVLLW